MEFARALDALMVEVRSGSLDGVRTFTESLDPHRVRPVLARASLLYRGWRGRIGTLRVSQTSYGATRLVRCAEQQSFKKKNGLASSALVCADESAETSTISARRTARAARAGAGKIERLQREKDVARRRCRVSAELASGIQDQFGSVLACGMLAGQRVTLRVLGEFHSADQDQDGGKSLNEPTDVSDGKSQAATICFMA
jgi:hypothetical protein